jgi:predicted nucleotidyltransferase
MLLAMTVFYGKVRTPIVTGFVMHPLIDQRRAEIAALCRRYGVRRLEVFGSAARGVDFDPAASDADFLVDFDPPADMSPLRQFFGLAEDLQALLGRKVDLAERKAVESSRNYIRRGHILDHAQPIYG